MHPNQATIERFYTAFAQLDTEGMARCYVQADASAGSAHWHAWYRFSATGRMVHNSIDARFEFEGLLLGWTPLLRAKVRQQAGASLRKFMEREGAPS